MFDINCLILLAFQRLWLLKSSRKALNTSTSCPHVSTDFGRPAGAGKPSAGGGMELGGGRESGTGSGAGEGGSSLGVGRFGHSGAHQIKTHFLGMIHLYRPTWTCDRSKLAHSSCWNFHWGKGINDPLSRGDLQQLKLPMQNTMEDYFYHCIITWEVR